MIQPIGGLWIVVSSEIIPARCPAAPEAIRAAVQVAVDEPGRGRTVVRDSARYGFSRA